MDSHKGILIFKNLIDLEFNIYIYRERERERHATKCPSVLEREKKAPSYDQ